MMNSYKLIAGLRRLAIVAIIGAGLTVSSHASAACTGGSALSGVYGLLVGGTSPTTGQGKFLSGVIGFDGACNLGGQVTGGINGSASLFVSISGTYSQNADNTITVNILLQGASTAQTYVVGYSSTAKEALGIETDGSAVATIDLQAQNNSGGYAYSSLKGTYAVECSGVGASYSDLNYVTFDGNGNLSGLDYYDNSGNQGTSVPYTGTYAVTGAGVFGGALQGSFSVFTYVGVIDNGTNEIQFIYIAGGAGITTCSGKKV